MKSLKITLALAVSAILLSASALAEVSVSSNEVLFMPPAVANFYSMEVRIVGPSGDVVLHQQSYGEEVSWACDDCLDGTYSYEARTAVKVGEKDTGEGLKPVLQVQEVESGRFTSEGGILSPVETPQLDNAANGLFRHNLVTALLNWLVPSAHAADIWINDPTPTIYFDDTQDEDTTPSFDWDLWCDGGTSNTDRNNFCYFRDWENGQRSAFYLKSGASYLYTGIGTGSPSASLHIATPQSPKVLFDSSSTDFTIGVYDDIGFSITHNSWGPTGQVLTIENDLGMSLYPGLGIWESDPEVPLHVGSHDGKSAELIVENTIAPTAAGDVEMFALENTGNKIVRFKIQAGGSGSRWTFDNEPTYNAGSGIRSGRFRIAKVGTGVAEFSVDGYGHGRFHGNSYAMNHVNTCARDAKTDFQSLNERDILAKVMQLPLSQWRYKQEAQDARHIGPVAEDFQEVFGLGDGKHISTVDADGVALAAIKAIKAEKDAEIVALKEENRALAERLEALEELVLGRQKVALIMQ